MALVADSFHMLSDVVALCVALASVRFSKRHSPKNTFGWARAEVLGALVNAVFLLALCFSITVESIKRIIVPEEVTNIDLLLIVGGIGLAFNFIGLVLFRHEGHGHAHGGGNNHGGGHEHSHGHAHGHSHKKHKECMSKPLLGDRSEERPSEATRTADQLNAVLAREHSHRDACAHESGHHCCHDDNVSEHKSDCDHHDVSVPSDVTISLHDEKEKMETAHLLPEDRENAPVIDADSMDRDVMDASFKVTSPYHVTIIDENGHMTGHEEPHRRSRVELRSHSIVQSIGNGFVESEEVRLEATATTKDSSQLNMRGVFLHVLGDFLGSVIVILSGLAIKYIPADQKWKFYIDPGMSIILVIILLNTIRPLVRESAMILLQTVPTHIQVKDIKQRLESTPGVLSVHELHVWQLAGNKIIASVHIQCASRDNYMEVAERVKSFFHNEGIHSTTVQPEYLDEDSREDHCAFPCAEECAPKTCCGNKRNASLQLGPSSPASVAEDSPETKRV